MLPLFDEDNVVSEGLLQTRHFTRTIDNHLDLVSEICDS
jgi:hypothetical protein